MTPRTEGALPDRELVAEMRALELVAAWQSARRDHDYKAAARAERELERFGVMLRAIRPVPRAAVSAEEARP